MYIHSFILSALQKRIQFQFLVVFCCTRESQQVYAWTKIINKTLHVRVEHIYTHTHTPARARRHTHTAHTNANPCIWTGGLVGDGGGMGGGWGDRDLIILLQTSRKGPSMDLLIPSR